MQDAPSFIDQAIFATPDKATSTSAKSNFSLNDFGFIDRFLREDKPLLAIAKWAQTENGQPLNRKELKAILIRIISNIDKRLNNQVNAIIHHPSFQKIEASWRGLYYLTDQTDLYDKENRVKVRVLDCSWQTLSKDISRAIEFDQSEFFKLIYRNEYDTPGGQPFGVVIGDYQISHKTRPGMPTNDLDTLKDITQTAAAAFSPFITAADPSLFGVDHFSELGHYVDMSHHFEQLEYTKWQALRRMDDARFLGLTMPQILMRSPYKQDGTRAEGFKFKEQLSNNETDYLWGNASYAFAAVLIRAFCESGWFGQIRGLNAGQLKKGVVTDLPGCQYETEHYQDKNKPSVNLLVGDNAEKQLSDEGFIPLSSVPFCDHLVFFGNASAQKPIHYDTMPARVNAKLSSMLQYILCVSRFSHYIKVIARDKVGSFQTAADCERELQSWLHKYTTASESASDEVRSKFPLYAAQVKVKEARGKPGHYFTTIHLQPHFQLDQMVSTIKLVTELTPPQNS